MGDIKFKGEPYTWANNREGEGFIQERQDRFYASIDWMLHNDKAEVLHVLRQASNHSLIILISNPTRAKTGARFIFEASWTKALDSEELLQEV